MPKITIYETSGWDLHRLIAYLRFTDPLRHRVLRDRELCKTALKRCIFAAADCVKKTSRNVYKSKKPRLQTGAFFN